MRGRPGRRLSWIVVIGWIAVARAAESAQEAEAAFNVTGRVLDASGAPVVGATVTAAAEGAAVSSTATDAQGMFRLTLAPGAYTLRFAADGFLETAQSLKIAAGAREARDVVLEIAGVREIVRVDAPGAYEVRSIRSATKTATPLSEVPQSVTVVTEDLIDDQQMRSMGDVVRYVPGMQAHQGENNRDDVVIRGNRSSADFFVNGVRDDVQYYRDLYNLERVEALKGPNAMIFGRGGGGGVVNRVTKEAEFRPFREVTLLGGGEDSWRATADIDQPLGNGVALRVNGMYEDSGSFRDFVGLERAGVNPTLTFAPSD
ncbi:MAG TPA: TonB-dependent receptor plug domain-containing protein, partial [Thermoanaerobaculia bacterium]